MLSTRNQYRLSGRRRPQSDVRPGQGACNRQRLRVDKGPSGQRDKGGRLIVGSSGPWPSATFSNRRRSGGRRPADAKTKVAHQGERPRVVAEQVLECIHRQLGRRIVSLAAALVGAQGGAKRRRAAPLAPGHQRIDQGAGIEKTEIDALPRQRMDHMRGITHQGQARQDILFGMLQPQRKGRACAQHRQAGPDVTRSPRSAGR